jgi:hypothetical protein
MRLGSTDGHGGAIDMTGERAREPLAPSPPVRGEPVASAPTEAARAFGSQAILLGAPAFVDRLGPGQPLDPQARQRMESAFGESFADVRVHTGRQAGDVARGLSARALTVGEHIAFAPGQYRPGTPIGDAMLAHELAHTLQQEPSGAHQPGAPVLEPAGSALEGDAESAAMGAMRKLWSGTRQVATAGFADARPALRSGLRVQRCGWQDVHRAPDDSIGFQSCGFTASQDPVRFDYQDHGDWVAVGSNDVFASAQVRAVGAPDEVARRWQAGFTQTEHQDRVSFRYAGGGRSHSVVWFIPGPRNDRTEKSEAPWYDSSKVQTFPGANSAVTAAMRDGPILPPSWYDHGAPLVSMTGRSSFCSWLIVKHVSSKDPIFLNWDTWEVNWEGDFDAANKKFKSGSEGGAYVTDQGEGIGPRQPVLAGETSKQATAQGVSWE